MDEVLPEWYNMDITLAKLIAEKLRLHVEKDPHSVPLEYETVDAWHGKLNRIASILEAYQKKFELDLSDEVRITQQAQEAIREFADVFPNLWI